MNSVVIITLLLAVYIDLGLTSKTKDKLSSLRRWMRKRGADNVSRGIDQQINNPGFQDKFYYSQPGAESSRGTARVTIANYTGPSRPSKTYNYPFGKEKTKYVYVNPQNKSRNSDEGSVSGRRNSRRGQTVVVVDSPSSQSDARRPLPSTQSGWGYDQQENDEETSRQDELRRQREELLRKRQEIETLRRKQKEEEEAIRREVEEQRRRTEDETRRRLTEEEERKRRLVEQERRRREEVRRREEERRKEEERRREEEKRVIREPGVETPDSLRRAIEARRRNLEAEEARRRNLEAEEARRRNLETEEVRRRNLEAEEVRRRNLEAEEARRRNLEESKRREYEQQRRLQWRWRQGSNVTSPSPPVTWTQSQGSRTTYLPGNQYTYPSGSAQGWDQQTGYRYGDPRVVVSGQGFANTGYRTQYDYGQSNYDQEDSSDCPDLGLEMRINGLDCRNAIRTFGTYLCYSHELTSKLCCETCKEVKQTSNVGCEYGDHVDNCKILTPSDCYDLRNRHSCCATCERFKKQNAPAGCEYGDAVGRCDSVRQNPGLCYIPNNQRSCCQTCSQIQNANNPSCAYGDFMPSLCQPYDSNTSGGVRVNCYSPHRRKICCQTCEQIREWASVGMPADCQYGDKPISFYYPQYGRLTCSNLFQFLDVSECRTNPVVASNCCYTCNRYINNRG